MGFGLGMGQEGRGTWDRGVGVPGTGVEPSLGRPRSGLKNLKKKEELWRIYGRDRKKIGKIYRRDKAGIAERKGKRYMIDDKEIGKRRMKWL